MSTQLLSSWLADLEGDLDLDPDDLSRVFGVSVRTIERWQSGAAWPQRRARERGDELYDLQRDIRRVLGPGKVGREWMHGESRYLGGMRPVDALRAGRIDKVKAALAAMEHGFPV